MSFHSAYLKLTAYYVVIVMLISVIFSISFYQVSSHELNNALRRQGSILGGNPRSFLPGMMPDFEQLRIEQLQESSNNLIQDLIAVNLLILILSAGISYFLAKRTMQPIEEMVEVQKQFTADASHELRTPLTAMKTEIEVGLRDKNFNLDEAKSLLSSNLEEISKLEALSNNLLSLSKYELGNKMRIEKIYLSGVVQDAFKKIRSLAEKKKIQFEFNIPEIALRGNKESLTQLFVILFDNAIKYSPENTAVSTFAVNREKEIRIEVKDQGAGIRKNDLPHIFNRFFRIDSARTKEKTSGFGLGLSIAHKIIEMHAGKIEAESQPNKGTKFTITIPKKEVTDSK